MKGLAIGVMALAVGVINLIKPGQGEVQGLQSGTIRGMIMPHHELAEVISKPAVERLKGEREVDLVVLISPNHYRPDGAEVTTATKLSYLPVDTTLVQQLLQTEEVYVNDPELLEKEHGLKVPGGYLREVFKDAKFVPLAVTGHLSVQRTERLAQFLAGKLGENGLVVVSVDFAHGLMANQAMQNNAESIETIKNWDLVKLETFGDEHMDSARAVEVLMRTMQRLRATIWETWDNTHGAILTEQPTLNGTSYVIGVFRGQ